MPPVNVAPGRNPRPFSPVRPPANHPQVIAPGARLHAALQRARREHALVAQSQAKPPETLELGGFLWGDCRVAERPI